MFRVILPALTQDQLFLLNERLAEFPPKLHGIFISTIGLRLDPGAVDRAFRSSPMRARVSIFRQFERASSRPDPVYPGYSDYPAPWERLFGSSTGGRSPY